MNPEPENPGGPDNLQPIPFIEHSLDGAVIPQRHSDGYINATRLCQRAGKQFNDYHRLGQTKAFLETGPKSPGWGEGFRQ